jgi:hypothetical protein
MDWFWHAIWICLVVIPVTVLWVVAIFDIIFRRHDLRAGSRIALLIMVLFLPVIGALMYFGTTSRPEVAPGPGDSDRGDQLTRQPVQYPTFRAV